MKPPRRPVGRAAAAAPGRVRIIGGRWRSSRLDVPSLPGLRPSSDRVRETLFNWLQPGLPGARCLDLFAGTGALGLEAASRGAAQVVLVERDRMLAQSLRDACRRLGADGVEVVQADALAWLARPPADRFDVVFLDPPFDADLWARACAAVRPHLADGALVHVEGPAGGLPPAPPGWLPHRRGRTRDVEHVLYRVAGPAADTLDDVHGPSTDTVAG